MTVFEFISDSHAPAARAAALIDCSPLEAETPFVIYGALPIAFHSPAPPDKAT
jgi:hypothetical protein